MPYVENRHGFHCNRVTGGTDCRAGSSGGDRVADHTYRSANRNYCAALSEKYVRYVGRSEAGPRSNRLPDVDGGVALAKCDAGDTAVAIPILERKLINARVELPERF